MDEPCLLSGSDMIPQTFRNQTDGKRPINEPYVLVWFGSDSPHLLQSEDLQRTETKRSIHDSGSLLSLFLPR